MLLVAPLRLRYTPAPGCSHTLGRSHASALRTDNISAFFKHAASATQKKRCRNSRRTKRPATNALHWQIAISLHLDRTDRTRQTTTWTRNVSFFDAPLAASQDLTFHCSASDAQKRTQSQSYPRRNEVFAVNHRNVWHECFCLRLIEGSIRNDANFIDEQRDERSRTAQV